MTQTKEGQGIFFGWYVIAACSLIGLLSSSGRFSFTMFLPYLIRDLGWSRAELGFGLTLHMWIYGFGAVASGFFVDKYGPRVLMIVGGFFIMTGLVLTSYATSVLHFYIYYGVILAVGVSATLVVPNSSTARKWFVKKGGLAVAITTSGMTLGISLMSLIVPDLIDAFGWRKSWFYLGLILGLVIIIVAWLAVRKDPESMGLHPDGREESVIIDSSTEDSELEFSDEVKWTFKEAIKTRSFWLIFFAYAFFIIPVMGIMGHVAAWGVDIAKSINIPENEAIGLIKTSVFFLGICSVVGSFIGGPLSDKLGRRKVFIIGFIGEILITFYAVYVHNLFGIVVFSLLGGLAGGILVPLWAPYVGDIFGRASLGSLFGLLTLAAGFIGGTGPVIFGRIFDIAGSYRYAFTFAVVCYFMALVLITLVKKQQKL